jgi:hypothetical protein
MTGRLLPRLSAACVAALLAVTVLLAPSCASTQFTTDVRPGPGTVRIGYFGQSMITALDQGETIVVDPFHQYVGFPFPLLTADLVLVSQKSPDVDNWRAIGGSPKVFALPGMFSLHDVLVLGLPSTEQTVGALSGGPVTQTASPNTMFAWTMEGLRFAHLGNADSVSLTQDQRVVLSNTDVLFVPVGGKTTLDARGAAAVIRELGPKVVVPIHYRTGPSTMDIAGVEPFLALMPRVRHLPQAVAVSKGTLPKATEVWVMDWR